MGYLKNQKEKLEGILTATGVAVGIGAGMYFTRKTGNSMEGLIFKGFVLSAATAVSVCITKFIDEAYVVPYFRRKAERGYIIKGAKKYLFNKAGKCVDVQTPQIMVYERDL